MTTLKMPLKIGHKNNDSRYDFYHWKTCLPFLENSRGVLIHRPRDVVTIDAKRLFTNKQPYMACTHWCGNSINGGEHWTFLSEPPKDKVICARCEMFAVEAGLPSSDEICGKHVHIGGVKAVITCCKGANNDN